MSPAHPLNAVEGVGTQLGELAPVEGANTGLWSGLTTYRFSSPTLWTRRQSRFLSLIVVVQGRHELSINRSLLPQAPYHLMVLSGHAHVDGRVLEASFVRPYLCAVLEIDPGLVRRVASTMPPRNELDWRELQEGARPTQRSFEHRLLEVVIRAGNSLTSDLDRRVLTPLYQQEVVYWLLRSDQGRHAWALAATDSAHPFIPAVIEYARDHLTQALSVAELADVAHLSTSAFAHRFRDATGRPPYQFVRDMRLYRARELLADGGATVGQVSREVGYASVSQFSSAFRSRFGVTPRSAATYAFSESVTEMGNSSAGTG